MSTTSEYFGKEAALDEKRDRAMLFRNFLKYNLAGANSARALFSFSPKTLEEHIEEVGIDVLTKEFEKLYGYN